MRVQLECCALAGMFTLKDVDNIMNEVKGVSSGS